MIYRKEKYKLNICHKCAKESLKDEIKIRAPKGKSMSYSSYNIENTWGFFEKICWNCRKKFYSPHKGIRICFNCRFKKDI